MVSNNYVIPVTFDLIESGKNTWQLMEDFISTIPLDYSQCDNVDIFVNNYNIIDWSEGTTYVIGDIVRYNQYTYRCIIEHTAIDFNTDLSKWVYFVANVRLKKEPYLASDVNKSMYSPAADIQFDADFTVNETLNTIRLTQPLPVGTTLTIVKKTGTEWII